MRLIGIGDNVVDDYTHIRTLFPGGNALNVAVYAGMLGCESAYLGVFGTDAAAGHVFVGSNEGGVSKTVPMDFVFEAPGYLRTFSVAHTSAYSYMDSHLPRLHALGVLVSYDFSDDFDAGRALALCPHVDAGFFSCAGWGDDATTVLLANAVAAGCTIAVATRGRDDAILFDGRYWFRRGPEAVAATDTLGAGDAFIAGFLVTWAGGRHAADARANAVIERALDRGAAFAADICRVEGAFGHGRPY